ncbi:AAA family ATPase [Nonomuraea sp. NPDC055795]
MTLMVDRPANAEPPFTGVLQIDPDPEEFAQVAEALNKLGLTLTPDPEWASTWLTSCPLCLTQGEDRTMAVFPWELPEYAGSVATRCQEDRHHIYEIGSALGINTRLMRGILDGRAELRRILLALTAHGLKFTEKPSPWSDTYYEAQCSTCAKSGRTGMNMEVMVDDLLDPDNETFGHVTHCCDECGRGHNLIADLGIVTRLALRESYGAITWDAPAETSDWLIKDLVERGQFVKFYGLAGIGKSLLAQEQAFRLAEEGMRVLYLDHENAPDEVKKRRQAMGFPVTPPPTLTYLSFPPLTAFDTEAGAAKFHALVGNTKQDVIYLDTWSKFISGDEASPSTHTAAYNLAIVPLRRRGITTIALDHAGKDLSRGPRGGSSKGDNVDVLWLLTAKSNGHLRLERRKCRTGRGPDLVELERLAAPLRHERIQRRPSDVLTADVRACIAKLDELEVPHGWGRGKASDVLRANDYKIRAETLNTALRVRRGRGNAPSSTLDLSEDDPA